MIRTVLEITLTLVRRMLRGIARVQRVGDLVVSLAVVRQGYEKKRRAQKQGPEAWKQSSSIWELRFYWRRHHLDQR
jgi:hypothetical protein